MLDPRYIFENKDTVLQGVRNKNEKRANIEQICALYDKRRKSQQTLDKMNEKRNKISEEVNQRKKNKQEADDLIEESRKLGVRIKQVEEEMRKIDEELQQEVIWVPNLAASDVPVGPDASANKLIRTWGKAPEFDFAPKDHTELIKQMDIVDLERGARLGGSHMLLFKGLGAKLERALINFMLDLHTKQHGYVEVSVPYLSNRDSMFGTGQLPKLENDMYRLKDDDLFLIPTAEVPVTNIHRGEILESKKLPVYYVCYSACFRREAGAYGADTRGMMRIHQFDKVELVKLVKPESSFDELEKLLHNAETVLQQLELHYRIVLLSTGDMSFASAKTYDIEAWAPGLNRWLEVSSCSNFTDFQARRASIRFRDDDGRVKFVHTLNGSGLALPRTVIAILEQHQQRDGSVKVPAALRPYLDGMEALK